MYGNNQVQNLDYSYKPNINGAEDLYGDRVWTNSEGHLHREDGPAVVWLNNNREGDYYIDGESLYKYEWIQWLKEGKSSLDQRTVLKLILKNS